MKEKEIAALLEENLKLKTLLQERENALTLSKNIISQKDTTIAQKEATIIQKEATIIQKEATIADKLVLIEILKRMVYGQKRERFLNSAEGQLRLPFEVDIQQVEKEVLELQKQKSEPASKSRKPHPGRLPLPGHLEVRETIIEPQGDLSDMICIGEEITEELEMEPAKYYIHRIIRRKYAPRSAEGAFKIGALPDRPIEKGKAGAGVISQAIVDKYVDHLPIYRQVKRFARDGIELKEATIHSWVQKGIGKLAILYDFLWQSILKCGYLQVDETTIKVLESENKNAAHLGYYWVYNDPIAKIPIFKYEKGRSGEFPTTILKTFKGFLQTDGYGGYNRLGKREDVIHVSCWAHVRREFDRALANNGAIAETALLMIQHLYQIEREAASLTPEHRKELRLDKSLPIVNTFFKWIAQQRGQVLPKSQIGKAINYAIARYESLLAYLYNGNILIDNNAVENSIRPVALGRKNYLFCKTHETAQRGAIIYTFMAICKTYNVNPFEWLKHTLSVIDSTSIQNLDALLPQNFKKNM